MIKMNSTQTLPSGEEGFHIGNLIKAELERQGRTITWLADEVHYSRENLYKVFRRPWIHTDLLFKLCDVLHHDFFKDCSDVWNSKSHP